MQLPEATPQSERLPAGVTAGLAQNSRLRLTGIVKQWARKEMPVLDAVNLNVAPGTLVSVVGANGAGKTTFLRIAAGLIAPDKGSVRLDNLDPFTDRREFQRRLGFLSAGQAGLYARLSVRAHLEYWATISFVPRAARNDAVASALERFLLGDLATRRVDRLSAGQRQRVRLALTFLHKPTLVLLDEPQNSLDDEGLELLRDVLCEITSSGATAICCSPNADKINSPNDVYELRDGRLVHQ